MRISSIGNYPTRNYAGVNKVNKPTETGSEQIITFKSGNPKHVFHQISEINLFGFGSGGVATVGNDFFFNHKNFDRVVENIPLYNQNVEYKKDIDPKTKKVIGIKQDGVGVRTIPASLPDGHPLKAYEGAHYISNVEITKMSNVPEILRQNAHKVFIVDEIHSASMEWGLENQIPISIYKARKDDRLKDFLRKNAWTEEQIAKTDITFTYVDTTASMVKPYADGSYATATGDELAKNISVNWQGKPYAKQAKATVELLPSLKEGLDGFDPKYVVCHDSQAMPLIHFAAQKNATGGDFWQNKSYSAIGHNMNDGYMYNMGTKDAIVCLAKPHEIRQILNSPEFVEAQVTERTEEFLKTLLPKEILDGRGQINSTMFAIAYAEKDFTSMLSTVSEGYYKAIIENELVSPALHEKLAGLSKKGKFRGIINALMDPLASGLTTKGLQTWYQKDCKVQLKNGEEVILPQFKAFDEATKYDLESIREVKRHNKISLLKRLDSSLEGSKLFNGSEWLEAGTGFSAAVTGGTGRKVKLYGGIDKKYIEMLESHVDVPMFISWGRGDFQKGMDTGLEAFAKFVRNTGDQNSIYIFGGDMKELKEVVELTKTLSKDELFKGRILLLDGWTPGSSLAAAGDYAPLLSRFAPCELTDLEAMKKGCIPITPKVQGMDQKVFDPTDKFHADKMNGYKGSYEYYMTEAQALGAATDEEKAIFNDIKNTIKKSLEKDYKSKIGEEIPQDLLETQIKNHEDYKKALKSLRDAVISDDIAKCMERALGERNTDTAKQILKNHMDMDTTFDGNGWLSETGKSTGELYQELHYNPKYGKNIAETDVLKLNLSELKSSASSEKEQAVTFGAKIKNFLGTKTGKVTVVAACIAAIGGIYYAMKNSKNNKNANIDKSNKPSVQNKQAEKGKQLSSIA